MEEIKFNSRFDKLVYKAFPRWALRREFAREQYKVFSRRSETGWDSFSGNRLKLDWPTGVKSADSATGDQLPQIRSVVREFVRNNPLVAGTMQRIVNNEIGNGIKMESSPRIDGITETQAKRFAKEAEPYFEDWGKGCDNTGGLSWGDCQRLVRMKDLEDGELFVRIPYQTRFGKRRLVLEFIEADRVESPLKSEKKPVNGIVFNSEGFKEGFYITPKHPGDMIAGTNTPEFFAAYTKSGVPLILHLMTTKRPGQTRGWPKLAPGIGFIQETQRLIESIIVKERVQAASVGVIEQEASNDPTQLPFPVTTNSKGEKEFEVESGNLPILPAGMKLNYHTGQTPTPQLAEFLKTFYTQITTTLDIPYSMAVMDYTGINFAGSRAAILDARQAFRSEQWRSHFNFYQEVYRIVVMDGIARREISVPENFSRYMNDYLIARPKFTRWPWVDPLKDVKADVEALNNYMIDPQSVANSRGFDMDDIIKSHKKFKEKVEKEGLSYPQMKPDTGGISNEAIAESEK